MASDSGAAVAQRLHGVRGGARRDAASRLDRRPAHRARARDLRSERRGRRPPCGRCRRPTRGAHLAPGRSLARRCRRGGARRAPAGRGRQRHLVPGAPAGAAAGHRDDCDSRPVGPLCRHCATGAGGAGGPGERRPGERAPGGPPRGRAPFLAGDRRRALPGPLHRGPGRSHTPCQPGLFRAGRGCAGGSRGPAVARLHPAGMGGRNPAAARRGRERRRGGASRARPDLQSGRGADHRGRHVDRGPALRRPHRAATSPGEAAAVRRSSPRWAS